MIAAQETFDYDFRSGPATGRKKFSERRASVGRTKGDDGI